MKNIGAYKKWVALVMAAAMGLHIFSGLRLFCPGKLLPAVVLLGIGVTARAVIPSDIGAEITAKSDNRNGASKCGCNKQKSCPVIPRAAIASNPTQRFNEVQRQFKSGCCHSLVSHVADYRLVTGSDPPLIELACTSLYSSTPLALACVLLI
jgi:hypothetical protein